ncbi:MAG: GNAT family protein [Parasphingorhabdus sp.]
MHNELNQPIGELVPKWTPPPFPSHEIMQGRYCNLQPLHAGRHAQDLYSANSLDIKGRNWTYLAYGPFNNFDSYFTWVELAGQSRDPQFYSIVDRNTGKSLGVASYLRISPSSGSIEVGHIHYSPALIRTIAATESMFLMMRKAFELGYRRYEWKCDALNLGSRKAAQRLGLSFEGIFRQATVYKGRNRDTAWFAAIDREWPALKSAFERWLDPSNFDGDGSQSLRLSELTSPIISSFDPLKSIG